MKTILKSMKMSKYKIPGDKINIFEDIIQKYEALNAPSLGSECDEEFSIAMEKHLTKEQRFRLFEQNGSCKGTSSDKERNAFAFEHAGKTLAERLEIFNKVSGRNAVLNEKDNTITFNFACTHGYYKRVNEGKYLSLPKSIKSYFERCAGGRLYGYEKALGIKLKIKSVDISPLKKNMKNPVVFTFEIIK
ncbi:MAG: hypothetical protein FWD40_08340 [Treponema sp.]|nr:hypothetical protein [Treponema sp.]